MFEVVKVTRRHEKKEKKERNNVRLLQLEVF